MTATDNAYEAPAGQFQSRVTITWPGGPNPIFDLVADVSIDRSIQDQPQSVTQIAGAAAAQATITLKSGNGTYLASMLSPFSTNAWSTRNVAGYGVNNIPIVIEEGILVSGSYVYTTLFTGTITNYLPNDDGSVALSCTDRAASIQGTANLPAAGGIQASVSGDTRLTPLTVADLALRSGMFYLTPPAKPTAVLSVTGVGGFLPEVGGHIYSYGPVAYQPSPWPTQLPNVDVAGIGQFSRSVPYRPWANASNGTPLFDMHEGWFYLTRPPSGKYFLFGMGSEQPATEVYIGFDSTGHLVVWQGAGGATAWTSSSVYVPAGSNWVYLMVRQYSNGFDFYDGAHSETAAALSFVISDALDGRSQIRLAQITLGFQAWSELNTGQTFTSMATNLTWTPNYTAYLDSVPQRLSGIAKQTGAAWSLIQQLAQAYGDVAYWDGVGAFHYETRTTWAARRYVTPTYLKDDSRIISGSPSWGQDSLRRSVGANVVVPAQAQSTVLAPAFVATEIYTVPASSGLQFSIDLDYAIYDIKSAANGWQSDANSSWVRFVAASSVGDPAATLVAANVGVAFGSTSSGIAMYVANNNPFPISLWSPGDGGSIPAGPYLIVHGKTVTFPSPRAITVSTGSGSGDDLVLDDNPWRQDVTQAGLWVNSIASDVSVPQIIWGSINVPLDPRLTIGTVVAVKDSPYMDVTHPVQIVGIAYDMTAEGMHTMTLTIRSAYAPTGWILDVPGRSELDSTTLLIV